MTAIAMLMSAAACALLVRGPSGTPGVRVGRSRARFHPQAALAATAAVCAAGLLVRADGTDLVLGLILLGSALGVGRLVSIAHGRRTAVRTEDRVLELCEALAGELRSGQPPSMALGHCVHLWSDFEPVAAAARLGADIPDAMRRVSDQPGAHGLRSVAGAWQVSQSSGAALSNALGQVAESTRAAQVTRRIVASELASAQATARLVAVLPLVALLMGAGAGGDPWGFLLTTPFGLTCLAAGLGLIFVGLLWIERLAAGALR